MRALQAGPEVALLTLASFMGGFLAFDQCVQVAEAALAQDLCASVAQTMQQTTASAWEPEVFQRLQQYATSPALAVQDKDQEPR